MISDYMGDLEINNPFSHLKPSQKTPYEKQHGKYITKTANGKYVLYRAKNGKVTYYGRFDNFNDAVEQRDYFNEHGWIKPKKDPSVNYYKHIWKSGRHYNVGKGSKYNGCLKTIEEALYYRDICKRHKWKNVPKPKELDLKTDNLYLKNGLKYDLPKRLIIPPKAPRRMGTISSKGEQFYGLTLGKEYYGGYRTFEMAYYVREKLNECGWDKSQLDRIVDEYPVWYTELNYLYQYVTPRDNGWVVGITPKHSSSGKLEHLYFHNLEDALWERDLLLKYNWDEELLIECADDSKNPYYDMELPPYPQRKVRRIKEREPRTDLFNKLYDLINNAGYYNQEQLAQLAGTNAVTIRNILRNEYDTTWEEFKGLCESGTNPNDVLEQKPLIYQPNLERRYDNTNYVSHFKNLKTPYVIYHRNKETQQSEYFGAYPTRELADKISNDLQKCDWDKSKLKEIQAKHGWQSIVNSKRWISEQKHTLKDGTVRVYGYQIRKKNKQKKHINFGWYKDKRVAELVRDLLVDCDWDKSKLEAIQDYANYCIEEVDKYEGYKGY